MAEFTAQWRRTLVRVVLILLIAAAGGALYVKNSLPYPNTQQFFMLGNQQLVPNSQFATQIANHKNELDSDWELLVQGQTKGSSRDCDTLKFTGLESLPTKTPLNFVVQTETEGERAVRQTMTITHTCQVILSSDKYQYQPGQTVYISALVLDNLSLSPIVAQGVNFLMADAQGVTLHRQSEHTSKFGIAMTSFQLAEQLPYGAYTLSVMVGQYGQAERIIKVTPPGVNSI